VLLAEIPSSATTHLPTSRHSAEQPAMTKPKKLTLGLYLLDSVSSLLTLLAAVLLLFGLADHPIFFTSSNQTTRSLSSSSSSL
jgi:hypothetical protein